MQLSCRSASHLGPSSAQHGQRALDRGVIRGGDTAQRQPGGAGLGAAVQREVRRQAAALLVIQLARPARMHRASRHASPMPGSDRLMYAARCCRATMVWLAATAATRRGSLNSSQLCGMSAGLGALQQAEQRRPRPQHTARHRPSSECRGAPRRPTARGGSRSPRAAPRPGSAQAFPPKRQCPLKQALCCCGLLGLSAVASAHACGICPGHACGDEGISRQRSTSTATAMRGQQALQIWPSLPQVRTSS